MDSEIFNLGLLFSRVAIIRQNRPALVYSHSNVSFMQLEQLSNRMAHYFLARDIKEGDVIALFNNKSPLSFAAMIASLKIGAVYVNLDIENPSGRLRGILESCNPKLIFTDFVIDDFPNLTGLLKSDECTYIHGQEFTKELELRDSRLPTNTPMISRYTPAYLVYTSGSTGVPKGVLISHDNVRYLIEWNINEFKPLEDAVYTNLNPMYFDNSVFDFFASLFNGIAMAPFTKTELSEPHKLIGDITERKCTHWFSVPSLISYCLALKAIDSWSFPSLRIMMFGGEGFPKTKLKQLYDLIGRDVQLVNVYGPSECTCICSVHRIAAEDFVEMQELPSLGTFLDHFDYKILTDSNDVGNASGELALLGPAVGHGYYNQPDLTEAAFSLSQSKFGENSLMYRTGDLISLKPEQILFRGRIDNQIKHMGYRIELEEIENIINSFDYVNESAAMYEKINLETGQIVLFVDVKKAVTLEKLRSDAKSALPSYMLPRKIVFRNDLKKNANGKIDRHALKKS